MEDGSAGFGGGVGEHGVLGGGYRVVGVATCSSNVSVAETGAASWTGSGGEGGDGRGRRGGCGHGSCNDDGVVDSNSRAAIEGNGDNDGISAGGRGGGGVVDSDSRAAVDGNGDNDGISGGGRGRGVGSGTRPC